ncbi:hypothetical protein ACE1OC_02515 [Streptomyces sp. DSM 116496]|uniref:hypothetical protein n=1 Tax=Streptomyces stoeckheimensis TaxID=3344656 RepID=UPI0038B3AAD1
MAELRAARAGEAAELTRLVMRSKAHWGYGAEFLAACAPELRIGAGDEVRRRIVVAEGAAGAAGSRSGDGPAVVLGLASLDGEPPIGRLGCSSSNRPPSAGVWGAACTGTYCGAPPDSASAGS